MPKLFVEFHTVTIKIEHVKIVKLQTLLRMC